MACGCRINGRNLKIFYPGFDKKFLDFCAANTAGLEGLIKIESIEYF
jgi:hypothetical protein